MTTPAVLETDGLKEQLKPRSATPRVARRLRMDDLEGNDHWAPAAANELGGDSDWHADRSTRDLQERRIFR